MSYHRKKRKTTFGEVAALTIVFLVADGALALLGWAALLFSLGIFEGLTVIVLAAKAIHDALPASVQKGLRRL